MVRQRQRLVEQLIGFGRTGHDRRGSSGRLSGRFSGQVTEACDTELGIVCLMATQRPRAQNSEASEVF